MRAPAEHFLTLRAFGAPPIVIALAAQGTFRGFMDTKTPLYAVGKFWQPLLFSSSYCTLCNISNRSIKKCHFHFKLSGAGNLLNAILDPILIFLFGLGIGGAAIATVISEYVNKCGKTKTYQCAANSFS